jgi:hypothetical protein
MIQPQNPVSLSSRPSYCCSRQLRFDVKRPKLDSKTKILLFYFMLLNLFFRWIYLLMSGLYVYRICLLAEENSRLARLECWRAVVQPALTHNK